MVSMEHLQLRFRLPSSCLICVVLLWCINVLIGSSLSTLGNESDHLALLAFKDQITQDPLRVMNSWNDSVHFCNWTGITCSLPDQRVVRLSLESQELVGSISPAIGNLTFLTRINLGDNSFHGKLPQQLGRLTQLQHLNVTSNSLGGEIPMNLTHCLDLKVFDALRNELIGKIPDQLSSLTKLVILSLAVNNLTGDIPPWIGNFSSLIGLTLSKNSLEGRIPEEFGRLSQLGFFQVNSNILYGTVPPSLYNLSSLYIFSIANNLLEGRLPTNVGLTLPNLQRFFGGLNNFQGQIPTSFSNASGLRELDLKENSLTGSIPMQFQSLQSLFRLNLGSNQLGSGKAGDLNILSALSNCSSLQLLVLDNNHLGGEIPDSVANLSTQLMWLTFGGNLIEGSIPMGIENLVNLAALGLELNLFTGSIPPVVGKLQRLQKLYLMGNRLSGSIPSSIGNLTLLSSLFLEENNLEGTIPPSLGNCQSLIVLNMSHNHLNGTIPKQVISLSSLSISFDVSHNTLSGSLPLEVGKMNNLEELDVSNNKFSGEIPTTLANCVRLERLHMGGNFFEGIIPHSCRALRGIREIDFSCNKLSGQIPEFLVNLSSLRYLNLSHNNFSGDVPRTGIFGNASAISVIGNSYVCGGILELQLPVCSKQVHHKSGNHFTNKLIASVVIVAAFLLLFFFFATNCLVQKWRKQRAHTGISSSEDNKMHMSYSELFKSTNGFSSDSLIGEGSFGSVYKAVFHDSRETVAVKVFNLQQEGASKSFTAECEVIKNIRHRNLVKIITACSSVDSKGNDFKALIMEFMPNGNLEQWLHACLDGQNQLRSLSFACRLNVAIDVASAVEYLHYHGQTSIAHCDLKPSNVLLDEALTAHVSDFGLAKFIFGETSSSTKNVTVSAGLKGSIGYVPPEYGIGGQVSILGDVYSYGILLLEMFTGKRPTGDMFKDGLSLYNFAMVALPDRIMDIIDPHLLITGEEEEQNVIENEEIQVEATIITQEEKHGGNGGSKIQECFIAVIKLGLSCSTPSPTDRIEMREALSKLRAIRNLFLDQ